MHRSASTALLVALLILSGCITKTSPPAGAKPGVGPSGSGPAPQARYTSVATPAENDPAAQEKTKLIGTWIATAGEFQGVKLSPEALKDMKWVFTADKVQYSLIGRTLSGSYTLNPATKPPSLDLTGPETAIQGIYELKGNTLKICCAATERPTSFATGGTSQDTLLFVFQKK